MKSFKTFLLIIVFAIITGHGAFAQITMTFPKAVNYVNNIPVGWTTSSPPSSISLVFTYKSGVDTTVGAVWTLKFSSSTNVSSGSFSFSPLTVTSNTNFQSVTPNVPMADGQYTVNMIYTRASDGVQLSSSPVVLTTDNKTLTPSLISPATNAYVGKTFLLKDNTRETPSLTAGTKKIFFVKGTDTTTLTMTSSLTDSFYLNIHDIASSSPSVVSATPDFLTAGNYNVTLVSSDINSHAPASSVNTNVTIDTLPPAPPVITSPAANGVASSAFTVAFSLPVTALSNSVNVIFSKSGQSDTLVLTDTSMGNHSLSIDADNLYRTNGLKSFTNSWLDSGYYSLKVLYKDRKGDSSSAISNFTLKTDNNTQAPTLILPAEASTQSDSVNVSFSLPETALANSVKLEFLGCSNLSVNLDALAAGNYTYTLSMANIISSAGVVSATSNTIAPGTYSVSLSYQDAAGNTRAYALNRSFVFASTVLGVELTRLKGYILQSQTHLQWETVSEEDLSYFDVEHSGDAKSFSMIGKVSATGNSAIKEDYQFIDPRPFQNVNFYRLKMVDADGKFRYSPVITVYEKDGKAEFRIFPNPTSDQLNVLITGNTTETIHTLKVWDANGRIVKRITVNAGEGSNLFTISMKSLDAGNYILQDGDNVSVFVKN